jgi:hypothetical protein
MSKSAVWVVREAPATGQAALPEYGSRYSRRDDTQALPAPLYHQRWHAESGFSQHKRRLGSSLTARRDDAPGPSAHAADPHP